MKRFIIGDIHGGFKALVQVLKRSGFNPRRDWLLFVGDYVDGWIDSFEVIEYIIRLKSIMGDRCVTLLGNHDDWFLTYLTRGVHPVQWMHGGWTTLNSYGRNCLGESWEEFQVKWGGGHVRTNLTVADIPKSHLEFFQNLQEFYTDEQNRAFVHGGYFHGLGLDHRDTYIWDRDLFQHIAVPNDNMSYIPKQLAQYKEVYVGHTTTLNWKKDVPMKACNMWNVDTGGGWHGKLTIMDIDTKDFWQSDQVKILYPGERGRM